MSVAGLVLLVACFNLANIFLARGSLRQQEIAVRLALGGTRFRIVRQLLIEGFLLSMMGGVAALLMAWSASSAVLSSLPTALPVLISLNASPDARVVAAMRLLVDRALDQEIPLTRARQRANAIYDRIYVERVLQKHGGSVVRAASAAGVARRYFQILKARPRDDDD